MTKKQTAAAVISAAGAAAPADQQLELMPPTRTNLTESERARVEAAVRTNKAGRPPGATNLATRQVLDFVRKTIGDPMIESARYLMHTPESLAIELGCTKGEAFDRLERIRADLRPYFYAKQAPVDADGKPAPWLTLSIGADHARHEGLAKPDQPPWTYLDAAPQQPQQNQQLTVQAAPASHGDVSHNDQ
jgi:hypothetical protein